MPHKLSETNPLRRQFELLEAAVEGVARGIYVFIAAHGLPGIGKTYTVEKTLKRLGCHYEIYQNTTPAAFTRKLYECGSTVLLLDDARFVMEAPFGPLLLAACENKPRRTITRDNQVARAAEEAGEGVPPVFQTTVRIIWLTNKDLDNLPNNVPQHVLALKSRTAVPLRFSKNPSDILDYVLWLATTKNILRDAVPGVRSGYSLNVSNDAVRWFTENGLHLDEISVRRLECIANIRKGSPTCWEALCEGYLLPTARSNLIIPPVPVIVPQAQMRTDTLSPTPLASQSSTPPSPVLGTATASASSSRAVPPIMSKNMRTADQEPQYIETARALGAGEAEVALKAKVGVIVRQKRKKAPLPTPPIDAQGESR